jgi:hypothetical protein
VTLKKGQVNSIKTNGKIAYCCISSDKQRQFEMYSRFRGFIRKAGAFSSLVVSALFVLFFPVSANAQTAEYPNYPVLALDKGEGIIAIADEPGGAVHSALSIAARVRSLGMTTVILEDHKCMSACALVFFAGTEKLVWGNLGVHQISSADSQGNMVGGQFALADVIDALNDYEVPSEVIGVMLRTPPSEMYVFSRKELVALGLNGKRQNGSERDQNDAVRRAKKPLKPEVDLSNPLTWRGKVITGALVSSGKKWYAELNPDGSTTFQFSSGQRSDGRYYLTETEVCFKLESNQSYACRRPIFAQDSIRWYDEGGNYQSVVLSVDETSFAAISPRENIAASVAERIPPGECALIVASRPSIAEARKYVLTNIADRRFLDAFRSGNGWISISIGTLKPDDVDPVLSSWKASGRIPQDSYCSTGTNFVDVVNLGLE